MRSKNLRHIGTLYWTSTVVRLQRGGNMDVNEVLRWGAISKQKK